MTRLLHTAQKKTSFTRIANKLRFLIKYTVETGLITTCWVLAHLAVFLGAMPYKLYQNVLFLSLSKVYANVLMGTLSSRIDFSSSSTGGENDSGANIYHESQDPNGHGRTQNIRLWNTGQVARPTTSVEEVQVSVAKAVLVHGDGDGL